MKYLIIIFLLALCGCQKERQVANEVMNRIVVKTIYKGNDTLYLKCYKPSSNIIYVYESEMDQLKILKDTLITEEEYNIKTINK